MMPYFEHIKSDCKAGSAFVWILFHQPYVWVCTGTRLGYVHVKLYSFEADLCQFVHLQQVRQRLGSMKTKICNVAGGA